MATERAPRHVAIGSVTVGNDLPLALIAGPCALESRAHAREMCHALVEMTTELGIGFVAYYAMGRGFLSGKLRTLDGLDPTDTRQSVPRLQEENIGYNLGLLDRLKEIAEEKGCTLAQLVLAWILHQGDDLVPIPGMTEMAYLEENIVAPEVELSADDLARIDAIFPLDGGAKGPRYRGDRSDKNR